MLAKDPSDSAPPTLHKVIGLPRNWTEHIVHVRIGGGGEIQATRMHPFWVQQRGWRQAKDLKVGDQLSDERDRPVTVAGIRIEDRTADTFNLTVEGVHTYYVLAGGPAILVHNGYGSYTITFKSGKQYVGKGDEDRANESAAEKSAEYNDPVDNSDYSPAANDEDAFLQEEFRMRAAGGPGNNTYNVRNSPGNNMAEKYWPAPNLCTTRYESLTNSSPQEDNGFLATVSSGGEKPFTAGGTPPSLPLHNPANAAGV